MMKKIVDENALACEYGDCETCKLRKGLKALAFMTMERLENRLVEKNGEIVKNFCFNLLKVYEEQSEMQMGVGFLIGLCDFYEDELLKDLLEGMVLDDTMKANCFIKLCVLCKEFFEEEYILRHVYEDDDY